MAQKLDRLEVQKAIADLTPQTYRAAGIPQIDWTEWDETYTSINPADRARNAREWHRAGISPESARTWRQAEVPFETALVCGYAKVSLDQFLFWRERGWSNPIAIALLLRSSGVVARETFTDYPRLEATILGRSFDGIWQLYDRCAGAPLPFISSMIAAQFLNVIPPANVVDPILETLLAENPVSEDQLVYAAKAYQIARWRTTQGIYRFDDTLREAIRATNLDSGFPGEALAFAPEPVVWIELDPTLDTEPAVGAFVSLLDYGASTNITVTHCDQAAPTTVHLPLEHSKFNDLRGVVDDRILNAISGDVALALYLSAPNAEIAGTPRSGAATRTKTGARFFPPSSPQIWEIGIRLGAQIRQYQDGSASAGRHRGAMRPHIRRAHFHPFRIGPRGGEQQYRVHWLPPIPINVSNIDEIEPVVHEVKGPAGDP